MLPRKLLDQGELVAHRAGRLGGGVDGAGGLQAALVDAPDEAVRAEVDPDHVLGRDLRLVEGAPLRLLGDVVPALAVERAGRGGRAQELRHLLAAGHAGADLRHPLGVEPVAVRRYRGRAAAGGGRQEDGNGGSGAASGPAAGEGRGWGNRLHRCGSYVRWRDGPWAEVSTGGGRRTGRGGAAAVVAARGGRRPTRQATRRRRGDGAGALPRAGDQAREPPSTPSSGCPTRARGGSRW
jgi:hypothetical protein